MVSVRINCQTLGNIDIVLLSEKCGARNLTQDKIPGVHEICIKILPNFLSWACMTFIILVVKIVLKTALTFLIITTVPHE